MIFGLQEFSLLIKDIFVHLRSVKDNWSETDLDYQVVLTEKGLNYLNKVFYEKIDSKSFPEFNRIIENEVLF